MTFDEAVISLSEAEELPAETLQWMLDHWDDMAAPCRKLLHAAVYGDDISERTQQALFYIIHVLGEKAETSSFDDVCQLLADAENAELILGDAVTLTAPAILISMFDTNPAHGALAKLQQLIEDDDQDPILRGELLLALGYLARTGKVAESVVYSQYAALVADAGKEQHPDFLLGWVQAVAAMGFTGLASRAEAIFKSGAIDPDLMTLAEFWDDLRASQADPKAMSVLAWDHIGPLGSAIEVLEWMEGGDDPDEIFPETPPEPARNPLRDIGRNDPCPCGSGKKYKKCCLVAS